MGGPTVGKRVRGALYVHADAVATLDPARQSAVARAVELAPGHRWNVARLDPADVVGLLHYPGFDEEAFPRLERAARVDLSNGSARTTNYTGKRNPLVLHRKELLVAQDHPRHAEWSELTGRLDALGLFRDANRIGRLVAWTSALARAGLDAEGRPA